MESQLKPCLLGRRRMSASTGSCIAAIMSCPGCAPPIWRQQMSGRSRTIAQPSTAGTPETAGRRALLLSGSTGMGHTTLAEAWADSLQAGGWSTQTLDLMRLLGQGGGSVGRAVFRSMLAVPGVYDAFHFAALRTGSLLADLTDAAASRQILPGLRAVLDATSPGLVMSVFATGASAVSRLAPRYSEMAHVVFCTDATPHRLWVHRNVDLYLVTSAIAERAVRRFDPEARVLVVPAPLRAAFYDPPTQLQARRNLGLPDQERCVLLIGAARRRRPLGTGRAGHREAAARESDPLAGGLAERVRHGAYLARSLTCAGAATGPDPQVGSVGPGRRREAGGGNPAHQPHLVSGRPPRRLPVARLPAR